MPLQIDDGYTLRGSTSGRDRIDGSALPVIAFEYRPPRASDMADFRYAISTATSGEAQHKVRVAFICSRLVRWDVEKGGKPVSPTEEFVSVLPDSFVLDLVDESAKWRPRPQAEAEKNS